MTQHEPSSSSIRSMIRAAADAEATSISDCYFMIICTSNGKRTYFEMLSWRQQIVRVMIVIFRELMHAWQYDGRKYCCLLDAEKQWQSVWLVRLTDCDGSRGCGAQQGVRSTVRYAHSNLVVLLLWRMLTNLIWNWRLLLQVSVSKHRLCRIQIGSRCW